MHKIILPILLISCLASRAQFNKGDKFIGGSLYVSHQDSPTNFNTTAQTNALSLSPMVGFFLSEKFAVGGRIGLGSLKNSYETSVPVLNPQGGYTFNIIRQEQTSDTYSAGAFGMRYFAITERILVTLRGDLSYYRKNTSNPVFNSTTGDLIKIKNNSYKISASLEPSFIFFPSNHWGISVSLAAISYSYGYSLTYGQSTNEFYLNYGSLSLGLNYYFRKSNNSVGIISR